MNYNQTTVNYWKAFVLPYTFALEELKIKFEIMNREAQFLEDYNPFEHIKTRLKQPKSIIKKLERKSLIPTVENAQRHLFDIIGIRITCCFVEDIYYLKKLIEKRTDMEIIEVKDYIKSPKPNGYKSLHMIIKYPLALNSGTQDVFAEIQLRTLAMDFWASLEHKMYYKYEGNIPEYLKNELHDAAMKAEELDNKMASIRQDIDEIEACSERILLPV
ncbi:GTP pyrophosphokinase family protein [Bacillus cytotoxicus]|uniref:GTP pyrophosphokinase family protein n=1 Tax=Bacillus cytotoxicus TaxID=580165 RepID=A0ACC6A4P6_9BACI|nr:GTP pyrophosphokinase family protein [Bacillus cytotoxicus]